MLFLGPGVQHQEHIHGVLSQGGRVPPIARWSRFPKGKSGQPVRSKVNVFWVPYTGLGEGAWGRFPGCQVLSGLWQHGLGMQKQSLLVFFPLCFLGYSQKALETGCSKGTTSSPQPTLKGEKIERRRSHRRSSQPQTPPQALRRLGWELLLRAGPQRSREDCCK